MGWSQRSAKEASCGFLTPRPLEGLALRAECWESGSTGQNETPSLYSGRRVTMSLETCVGLYGDSPCQDLARAVSVPLGSTDQKQMLPREEGQVSDVPSLPWGRGAGRSGREL